MTQDPEAVKFKLPECEAGANSTNLDLYTSDSVIVLENCKNEILTI